MGTGTITICLSYKEIWAISVWVKWGTLYNYRFTQFHIEFMWKHVGKPMHLSKMNIWVRGRHAANFNDEKTDVRFYNVTYTIENENQLIF